MYTYFPILVRKKVTLSSAPRFNKLKLVTSLPNERFKMACNKPVGAISMTIAFFGTCWMASWNKTGDSKLLT